MNEEQKLNSVALDVHKKCKICGGPASVFVAKLGKAELTSFVKCSKCGNVTRADGD